MKNYSCRINKIPFLLWFNNKINMKIDFEEQRAISEEGLESNIKKVNPIFVFAIKYLPLMALFLMGLKLPNDKIEYVLFLIGFVIAFLLQYLFTKSIRLLKIFSIGIVVALYVLLFKGYAFELEMIMLFMLQFIIVFFFYREIHLERYKNYYYLENFEKKATITLAKKKQRPIIRLWGDKGFFKKETGFDATRELKINGYYIRVEEEIVDV